MKCFYHTDRDAVGICKSCGKGLCTECASNVSRGLACKGNCEANVQKLNELIETNFRLTPSSSALITSARRTSLFTAVFFLVLGIVFAGAGWHWFLENGELSFMLVLGALFALYGLVSLFRALRIPPAPTYPPGFCRKCGYDLTGNSSGKCPECGKPV